MCPVIFNNPGNECFDTKMSETLLAPASFVRKLLESGCSGVVRGFGWDEMANFTLTPPYKPTVKSKKALRGAESGLDFGYFGDLWIRFSVERFGSGFMAGRCQLFRQQGGHASADSIQGHKTIRDRQRPTETDRKQQKLQSPLTLPV